MSKKKILITGGCGFIGHHFVEHVHKNTDWDIIILDKLSYASNGFERLRDTDTLHNNRVKVFTIEKNDQVKTKSYRLILVLEKEH